MRLVILASVATSDEMKELVEVLLVEVRLVAKALVVVELPTMRLVILASVATSDEMKELVEVLLVETRLVAVALTAVRLVVEAVVKYPLVAVIPVADAVLRFV
jgi:hypothetical protein